MCLFETIHIFGYKDWILEQSVSIWKNMMDGYLPWTHISIS